MKNGPSGDDTSALLAALLTNHEGHKSARPHLPKGSVPAIVLAETYSQLRRTFGLDADVASRTLEYWTHDSRRIAALSSAGYARLFRQARALDLGGNIHDALIAATCAEHRLSLVTLDRRQHQVALMLGVESTLLLDDRDLRN